VPWLEKLAELALAPALAAAAVSWVARRCGAQGAAGGAAALGLGIALGWSLALGGFTWPPRLAMDATHWLPWMALVGTGAAVALELGGPRSTPLALLALWACATGTLLLPAWSAIHHQWGWTAGLARLVALAGCGAAGACAARGAPAGRGAWIALGAAVPGCAASLALAGSVRLAELAIPVLAAAAALLVRRAAVEHGAPRRAAHPAWVGILALTLAALNGHAYAELPFALALVMVLGPAIGIGLASGRRAIAWAAAALLPVAAAAWLATAGAGSG
jgi:hypothetical protein